MLSLSQTTGYAVLALACLSDQEGEWTQTQEIADRSGVPKPYLSKILHALGQHGLIRAKRGYQGGFALSAPPSKISLLDVAEAVEGGRWAPKCILGLSECSDARGCPMHEFWTKERKRIADKLRHMSLAEMTEFEQRAGSVKPRTKQSTPSRKQAKKGRGT